MAKPRWHILRDDDGALTLARRLPARLDVASTSVMPRVGKTRLAHQIRQDLWRALQRHRGFSPVVRVLEEGPHLKVQAGGQVCARTFPKSEIEAQIAEVLDCPENRARWFAHARHATSLTSVGAEG